MKKVVTGGFLGLFGIIGLVCVIIFASEDLATDWYGNRLLYTIIQGDFSLIFFSSLFLLIGGIILMFVGCFKKDK
ncbi:MAG: hypothetical protein ACOX60_07280 [Massiliimalia sp.]|jgi:hypothetical protein